MHNHGLGAWMTTRRQKTPDKTALVFDGIMQQRGDGLILVCPVLQRDRRDGQQVRDIGNGAALALLVAV